MPGFGRIDFGDKGVHLADLLLQPFGDQVKFLGRTEVQGAEQQTVCRGGCWVSPVLPRRRARDNAEQNALVFTPALAQYLARRSAGKNERRLGATVVNQMSAISQTG
ncbi:hypothetical protein D3C76_1054200 [compost metagenome]